LVVEFGLHIFEVHFDTGLYQTHFDKEFCEGVGLTGNIQFPGVGRSAGRSSPTMEDYGKSYFTVDASILRKSDDDAFPITLTGIAAFNWPRSRFYRDCYSDCTYYNVREHPRPGLPPRRNLRMCVFRDGLLGRTLMQDNPNLRILLQHGKTDIGWEEG
jgi:hypothetical protein